MWKDGSSIQEKYNAARYMAQFQELIKVFPLKVVQKREGY